MSNNSPARSVKRNPLNAFYKNNQEFGKYRSIVALSLLPIFLLEVACLNIIDSIGVVILMTICLCCRRSPRAALFYLLTELSVLLYLLVHHTLIILWWFSARTIYEYYGTTSYEMSTAYLVMQIIAMGAAFLSLLKWFVEAKEVYDHPWGRDTEYATIIDYHNEKFQIPPEKRLLPSGEYPTEVTRVTI